MSNTLVLNGYSTDQIVALISKKELERVFQDLDSSLNDLVTSKLSYPCSSVFDPLLVQNYFTQVKRLLHERSVQLAQIFAPYEWVYHLTRLPKYFMAGDLESTFTYDLNLALYISSLSRIKKIKPVVEETPIGACRKLPLTTKKLKHLARFVRLIKHLSHIDVCLRRLSKGIKYIAPLKNNYLPLEVIDKKLVENIKAFDAKKEIAHRAVSSFFSPAGFTDATQIDDLSLDSDINGVSIPLIISGVEDPISLPIKINNPETVKIKPNYLILPKSLNVLGEYFLRLNRAYKVFDNKSLFLVLLSLLTAFTAIVRFNLNLISFYSFGYFLVNKKSFERHIKDVFEEIKLDLEKAFSLSVDAELEELLKFVYRRDDRYPCYGPFAIDTKTDNQLCINFFSSSSRLSSELEHQIVAGEVANIRGSYFEERLQYEINSTERKPAEDVLQIISLTSLNLDGQKITDIDAAFVYEGHLILVSAKSYIYNSKYDSGDYAYIRNTKEKLEKDIIHWRAVIQKLNENPVGDNYDLSEYLPLEGIICTPSVFYIDMSFYGSQLKVSGLKEYLSSPELFLLLAES